MSSYWKEKALVENPFFENIGQNLCASTNSIDVKFHCSKSSISFLFFIFLTEKNKLRTRRRLECRKRNRGEKIGL